MPSQCRHFPRPVSLLGVEEARFDSVYIRQRHENGQVALRPEISMEIFEGAQEEFSYECKMTHPDGTVQTVEGSPEEINILNPQLWWPNGLGEQPLYQVEVFLKKGEDVLDIWSGRIGLRTMTVRRERSVG